MTAAIAPSPQPLDQGNGRAAARALLGRLSLPQQLEGPCHAILARLFTGLAEGDVTSVLDAAEQRELLPALGEAELLDRVEESADPSGWGLSAATPAQPRPLVWHHGQLWLRRYWEAQQRVLQMVAERAATASDLAGPGSDSGDHWLGMGRTPGHDAAMEQWLERQLLVLTGGPGCGKTTLVGLLLLAELRQRRDRRIALAAPTGKAAARLQDALHDCAVRIGQASQALLSLRAVTLHRLLETGPRGHGRDRGRPLEADVVVVDEASMVDLPMLDGLLQALPSRARLLLIGDPAQLPAIGPGAPLEAVVRQGKGVVTLTHGFRNDGAIATVAALLRQRAGNDPGRAELTATALVGRLRELAPDDNLHWQEHVPPQLPAGLEHTVRAHVERLRQLACDAELAAECQLQALEDLVLLSPLRRGGWGVEILNRRFLGNAPSGRWPAGTPILCLHNAPALDLANGDVGLVLPGETALFRTAQGRRQVSLQRLPPCEQALALTIHKSQGSQYRQVVVLLPAAERQALDRRLLYTALTRARGRVVLITAPGCLSAG